MFHWSVEVSKYQSTNSINSMNRIELHQRLNAEHLTWRERGGKECMNVDPRDGARDGRKGGRGREARKGGGPMRRDEEVPSPLDRAFQQA